MKREELLQLYREEKDPNVKDRLMLNIKVRFEDVSITKAARSLGKVTSWGSKWFSRFAKADVEGLRNLPRSGRPPRITREEAEKIRKEMDSKQCWTAAKTRELVSGETGVRYSLSSTYKMLKRWEYSLKVPVKRHVRRPPDEEIVRFQEELARLIPQKIEEGFAMAVQDESVVLADARPGRVYTRKGRRAVCTVTGSHGKTIVCGLQTMDGRSMCAQYDRFTKEDFANYLKRASRRFPKILIILDRAPQHTANTVRQTERELEGPELKYLPPGCPDLNSMEEKWRQMKHSLLDVPYVTLGRLRRGITRYLRYQMPTLQIENYLYRKL